MNNQDSNGRYLEAMMKLHGGSKLHVCKHQGCQTLTLKQLCLKHTPRKKTDEAKNRRVRRGAR